MTDNPSNLPSDPPESENEQSQDSPSDQAFRKFNPNWEEEVFGNRNASGYQSEWAKKQDEWNYTGPRPWHRIFRDFLTMSDDRDCGYLLNEPTATAGQGITWYATFSGIMLAVFIAILAIIFAATPEDILQEANQNTASSYPTDTSPYRRNTQQSQEINFTEGELLTFYCVGGPIGIGLGIIIYYIFLAIVHAIATGVFNGVGEFDKLIYGAFTLYTAYYVAYTIAMVALVPFLGILLILIPAFFIPLYCLFIIVALVITFYMYYLYTLVVKTVYEFGWGQAFMSAIGIPFGGFFVLYCTCIFCLSSGSGGQ